MPYVPGTFVSTYTTALLPANGTVPSRIPPSKNWTVPVIEPPGEVVLTVAVSNSGWSTTDGFAAGVSVVVVAGSFGA